MITNKSEIMISEEDLYKRHKGVDMKVPETITVVGCGGTGTHIAIYGAMMGVKAIHLTDYDVLENHNRSRLPFKESDVGRLKTEVLKEYISTIRPDCSVYTYNEGIITDSDLFILTGDIIFDCNDNLKVQKMIYEYCKAQKLKYIGVGCNADHISIIDDLDLVISNGEDDQYAETPMFLLPAMIAAADAWWNVIKQKKNIVVTKSISSMLE